MPGYPSASMDWLRSCLDRDELQSLDKSGPKTLQQSVCDAIELAQTSGCMLEQTKNERSEG
jgi:hypothetical protein